MSPREIQTEPAPDGLSAIDVVELATAILHEGSRKETMVSQREIRAMAGYVMDANEALNTGAMAIYVIEFYGVKPTPGVHKTMTDLLVRLRKQLEAMRYIGEGEDGAIEFAASNGKGAPKTREGSDGSASERS